MTDAHKNNEETRTHSLQTYIINLRNASERWAHIKETLYQVGLVYTLIEAVLGSRFGIGPRGTH